LIHTGLKIKEDLERAQKEAKIGSWSWNLKTNELIWSPDQILMDMQMPVMDSYEVIRKIREMEKGKIQIIAVTASVFQIDRENTLEAGTDMYIRKPFKEKELFDSIKSCLDIKYFYE
jgi:CheY-like chemotaxis protein